jgi:hypothetical protein
VIRKTKPMRWNHVGRAAIILGIASDVSKAEMLKVAKILKRRVKEGKIEKIKKSPAQSSEAWYVGRMKT